MDDFGWVLLVVLIPALLALGLVIWALVDLAQRPMEPVMKVVWLAVILLLPFLGSLAYLIVGRSMTR